MMVDRFWGGLLFVPITMFDRFWFYDGRVLFLFTTTLVLFYHTILRLSSLFTLRRSILTAVMLGWPLFTSLVLSLREIGLGLLPNSTILFSSIITSSVYLHSLRFAGRFSRPAVPRCTLFIFLLFFHFLYHFSFLSHLL